MTDLPDPGTDPVPEEDPYRYPLLARLFGIDVAARQIADAIGNPTDTEALEAALAKLRAADQTIDNIEKGPNP